MFKKVLEGIFINRMEHNEDITVKSMNDGELQKEIYERLRKEEDSRPVL